jgi:glycosyltransferase 2 family protein
MKRTAKTKLSWQPLVYVAVLLLGFVVVVPQVEQLREGFALVVHGELLFLLLGLLSVMVAVVASGGTYAFLALHNVRAASAVLVQTANMLINRLLPAGVGGMGLNARFLYTYKHTAAQAAAVVATNNTLTGVGHFLLVVVAILLGTVAPLGIALPSISAVLLALGAVIFLFAFVAALGQFGWLKKTRQFARDLVAAFSKYKHRKRSLVLALCCAVCNTLGHTFALFFCMLAFDVQLSVGVALLVLTGGVAAASVTPTPGGIVGAEAGLAAGFISFGVAAPTAVAIAVSYRILSYWLPLLPGALAFFYIQKQKLI